jgi:serine/threonine-protein kinase
MQQIGRYRILGELGRGGMATVYRAFDPNVDREVAVKVLPQQFLHDESFRERFMREAKVIARLEHSAIVPIYDFGEQEGQPYLVMRYLPGGTLADRIQEGALTLEETSTIVSRIATALEEAHARGIVHRDLKPGNILFDANGEAFLSDFGIVKLAEASAALTGTGVVGTPTYMSPEQAYGDSNVDGRADVYSLGIITYEMLTGKAPYEADTPMGIAMKHILEPVPQILETKPDLPTSIGALLDRALAKDRHHRFKTASELADKLSAIAAGAQPEIEPVPEPDSSVAPLPDPRTIRLAEPAPLPSTGALIEGTPPPPATDSQAPSATRSRRGVPLGIVIAMVVGGLLLMACIAVVAFGQGVSVAVQNIVGGRQNALSGERTEIDIGQPLNDAEKLEVQVDISAARASIYGDDIDFAASGSYEAPAEFDGLEVLYDVDEEGVGSLRLQQQQVEFNVSNVRPGVTPELNLGLTKMVPIALSIDSGLGDFEINLEEMLITSLDIAGAAGVLNVTLPQKGEMSINITATAGELTLNTPGDSQLSITEFDILTGASDSTIQLPDSGGYDVHLQTGLGQTTLEVPEGLPVSISVSNSGGATVINDVDAITEASDGVWQSTGFDPDDPLAVTVRVRTGIGELIINER